MPCSRITASSVPRRPRSAPCTLGCKVLTRPSMISGKPVSSLISRTGTPASRSVFALPPVETNSTPSACNAWPRSAMPLFSETLSSARRTGITEEFLAGDARTIWSVRSGQSVRKQLLAQGGAIDAERFGRAALVAAAPAQHLAQQGRLHLAHQQRVQTFGTRRPVKVRKVTARAARDAFAQGGGSGVGGCVQGSGRIECRGFHVSQGLKVGAFRTRAGKCSAVSRG